MLKTTRFKGVSLALVSDFARQLLATLRCLSERLFVLFVIFILTTLTLIVVASGRTR